MLRRFLVTIPLALTVFVMAAPAINHRTFFVEKMDGLDSHVREALTARELRVVDSAGEADIHITLEERVKAGLARDIYENKLGRTDSTVLKAVDAQSRKVVASYGISSRMTDSAGIAGGFADKLVKAF